MQDFVLRADLAGRPLVFVVGAFAHGKVRRMCHQLPFLHALGACQPTCQLLLVASENEAWPERRSPARGLAWRNNSHT
jgi:hypothetical protein